MYVLYILQLFVGTILLQTVFGLLLTMFQRVLFKSNFRIWITIATILTITMYCIIAYYYSQSANLFIKHHGIKYLVIISTFLLLEFILFGPSKYAEIDEQKTLIFAAGSIGTILFVLLRFIPQIGYSLFHWLPIFIYV